ncbi:hypothetical protein EMPS_06927 [Entomortierella parvispora]|uniref:RRM domain-containing protein n=1 Tax=Entomortierella parvispora TaxID=205924 RepID=A0A9P3HD93_9FUNG|nr:hypothetical protein EMPS_06927 [Entomortierella parvispora]
MSGLLAFTKLAFAAPARFAVGNTIAARGYATKKLFVGNIAWGTTDEEAKEYFGQFGTLKDAYFPKDPNGRTKGFGFIELEEEEADRAIKEGNGAELNGRQLRIDAANPREERPRREFNNNREGGFRRNNNGGDREFRPRGGDREFRPRRQEGGDREFRPRREEGGFRRGGESSE